MKVDGLDVSHLVAKIERRDVSLCDFEIEDWFWPRLRAAFPLALASSLMPDHPHVVTPSADPEGARMRLNRLLGHLARHVGARCLGEAATPTRIADRSKLLRDLRYVDLNAPRERFADDPLSWWFSTHRDVVGATMDPWVDRAIRRSAEHTIDLSAARLCLGDARLLRAVPAWRDAA